MSRVFFISMASALACALLSASVASAEVEFEDNPFGFTGIAIGCAVIGAPTCIALWHRDEEIEFSRDSRNWGVELNFFPSYVLDLAESKAFQRIEATGYNGNLLLGLSHRRGLQEPNFLSSTSYRVAYSFDWRHLRPAIGVGARRNVNARNGDSFEIWLPLFANRNSTVTQGYSVFLETLWVIGPGGVRPEVQGRVEFQLSPGLLLAVGLGYFSDYDNAKTEFSIGPTFDF